jgi:hypothetical protein
MGVPNEKSRKPDAATRAQALTAPGQSSCPQCSECGCLTGFAPVAAFTTAARLLKSKKVSASLREFALYCR